MRHLGLTAWLNEMLKISAFLHSLSQRANVGMSLQVSDVVICGSPFRMSHGVFSKQYCNAGIAFFVLTRIVLSAGVSRFTLALHSGVSIKARWSEMPV